LQLAHLVNWVSECQLPPLYTSVKPAFFNTVTAEALRIPLAQQVIKGLCFESLAKWAGNEFNGMFSDPFTWPDTYSPAERTSTMIAPPAIRSANGVGVALPKKFRSILNILLF
jgi:hypothetical protein